MNRMWSMLTSGGRGRAIGLAVFAIAVPLLVMLALLPRQTQETIPVALVNSDTPITSGSTPMAAGKLLTENLMTTEDGIEWTLTDAATGDAGLTTGEYLAVVTIPSDFSADVVTLGSDDPTAATLQVETSTQHGYLSGVLAQALAEGLPRGVEVELTTGYVEGTLAAFSALHDGISDAAEGSAALAEGAAAAAEGADVVVEGQRDLIEGLQGIGTVLQALPAGVRDLGALSAAAGADAGTLAVSLGERAVEAELLSLGQDAVALDLALLADYIEANPTVPVSTILADVELLRDAAQQTASDLDGQARALATDAVDAAELAAGADAIAALADPAADALVLVADAQQVAVEGAQVIEEVAEALAQGLGELTTGAQELTSGLEDAAAEIPSYTTAQQQEIAGVVAAPITVETTSVGGPNTALAAAVAVLVPVSLWLGAMAIFLVAAPFARSALLTSAPPLRLAVDAALVGVGVALVQSVLVWLGVLLLGVAPDRLAVAFGFTLAVAVAFTLVHQALTALFGRVGMVISVLALGIQLAAAGTLQPVTLDSLASTPLSMLPLSLALQGGQALVGGSLHAVLQAAIGLLIWAAIALAGTVVGITRARARAVRAALAV